tara:strand:- start:2878 stop:6555 length:3678 start_codon:yes stop_codon:yes gene_type:complete
MEYGINRIILIDSFMKGTINEAKLNGHTSISGRNGAGKTSILQLSPIFYGELPSRICKQNGSGKVSFSDFYLPRNASYLVFEYFSRGNAKLSVFCPMVNGQPGFRQILIDSAYDPRFFIHEDNVTPVPSVDLLSRLRALDIPFIQISSLSEYKAILMDGEGKSASQYTIAPGRAKLSKLVPLFTGMFKRAASFSDLAEIIEHWAFDELEDDAKNNLRNLTINKKDFSIWLDDYAAYHLLDDKKHLAEEAEERLNSFNELDRTLRNILWSSKILHKKKLAEKDKATEDKTALQKEEERADKESADKLSSIQSEIDSLETEKNKNSNSIERIRSAKASYEEKITPEAQVELANINLLSADIDLRRKDLAELKSEGSDIRAPIEQNKNEERARTADLIQSLQEEKDFANERLNEQLSVEQDSHKEKISSIEVKYEDTRKTLDQKIKGLSEQIGEIAGLLKNPPVDAALINSISAQETKITQLGKEKEQVFMSLNKLQEHKSKVEIQYSELDKKLGRLKIQFDEEDLQLMELIDIRDCKNDSFLSFLKTNSPHWEQTFGKALRTEVLHAKKLNPEISGVSESSIFGIDIDVSALPKASLDYSGEDLDNRITELKGDTENTEREVNKISSELEKALKAKGEYDTEIGKLKDKLKEDTQLLDEANRMLNALRAQKETEVENATLMLTEKRSRLLEEQSEFELNQQLAKEEYNDQRTKSQSEFDAKVLLLQKNCKEQVSRFVSLIADEKVNLDQKIAEYNELIDQKLREKKIDVDTINTKESDLIKLEKKLKTLQGLLVIFEEYNKFMANDFIKLPDLENQAKQISEQINQAITKRDALRVESKKRHKDYEFELRQLDRAITDCGLAARNLDDLIIKRSDNTNIFPAQGDDNWLQLSAEKLISNFTENLEHKNKSERELILLKRNCEQLFDRYPNTMALDYWQSLKTQNASAVYDDPKPALYHFVGYYKTGAHDNIANNLKNKLSMLNKVDIYHNHLDMFEKRIKDFSRNLEAHIDKDLNFSALTEISPNISFSLDNLDHWEDIKALSNEFRNWKLEGANSLPSGSFIDAIKSFRDAFKDDSTRLGRARLASEIQFKFEIVENGKRKTIRSENDFDGISSNALSYIVLIVVCLGFIKMQRQKQDIHFAWALDELGNFDSQNIQALLKTLKESNISLITACPDLKSTDFELFTNRYHVVNENGEHSLIEQISDPNELDPFSDEYIQENEGVLL